MTSGSSINRRSLLLGSGALLGSGLVLTGASQAPAVAAQEPDDIGPAGHCGGPAIYRNWIGRSASQWPTYYCVGTTPAGGNRHATTPRYDHYNPTFHDDCNRWATNYDSRLSNVGHRVKWFGYLGVSRACGGQDSEHHRARAFDLTRIQYTDGVFVDMLWSWKQDVKQRRRYLAVVAHLRWYFSIVLTAWYDAGHRNHIHFDNGTPIRPITTTRSDTIIVQAAGRLLNRETLAMDGVWGSQTEAAYRRMLGKLNMQCLNPKTNLSHARIFFTFIARHGFYNREVGAWKYTGCIEPNDA